MSYDVHHERMAHYSALMEEIKRRQEVIAVAIQGKMEPLVPGKVAEELRYLQLRLVCESLALACLIAQGAPTRKLRGIWEADRIMKELTKVHPNFYPQPSRQILENGAVTRVEPITEPYLTRRGLIELWRHCGTQLHRGSLENLLSSKPRKLIDFAQIRKSTEDIIRLLSHHQISLLDPAIEYWVLMNPPSGKVEYYLMKKMLITR